jgi:t-SNARE complex subunit (syntaxin)
MQASSELSLPSELKLIDEMTAAMLVAAQKRRWKEVQRIDNARMKLLRTVPAELFRTHDEAVRRLLQEALSATQTIDKQAKDDRERHASELKHMNHRQSAAKAYGAYAQAR